MESFLKKEETALNENTTNQMATSITAMLWLGSDYLLSAKRAHLQACKDGQQHLGLDLDNVLLKSERWCKRVGYALRQQKISRRGAFIMPKPSPHPIDAPAERRRQR
jgi:hypothetical protein